MSSIDFITSKWRTVRRTRRLAYIHLASSVFPIIYVATYAEAQRRAEDTKELGAALAALMFNLIQLLRTLMGIVQLNIFIRWCQHGVECIRALMGANEEEHEKDAKTNELGDVLDVVADVEEKVKVNDSVVDNELGGTDVTVLPSFRRAWDAVKRGDFRPGAWLNTDQVELNTVRWCGAYLCGMGNYWSVGESSVGNAGELLASFFSGNLTRARTFLQFVTWNVAGENVESELVSIEGTGKQYVVDLSGETNTAYGSPLHRYDVMTTYTVESYSFEYDSLVGSYPASTDRYDVGNRKKVGAVELALSIFLAKHIGVEKLRAISRYYRHYRLPTNKILLRAFELYLKQLSDSLPEDSKAWRMIGCNDYQIPIFPYRMQMVALWDKATNWRVVQASAHRDINSSLSSYWSLHKLLAGPLFEIEPMPTDVFDYFSDLVRSGRSAHVNFLGLAIETVRTAITEWLISGPQDPDFEPVLSTESFEFSISDNFLQILERSGSLVWACQHALEQGLPLNSAMDRHKNLPSNSSLLIFFLLGLPGLKVGKVDPASSRALPGGSIVQDTSSPTENLKHIVDVNVTVWCVEFHPSPQDISVMIRVDGEAHTVSLSLKSGRGVERFKWKDWIDAAMGCIEGWDKREDAENKKTIIRGELHEPIVEMCPLREDGDGNVEKTGTARVRMGWPASDAEICKFEVEQWLSACNINLNALQFAYEKYEADDEVERAERILEAIISTKRDEMES